MPRPKSDTPGYCLHKSSGRAYATLSGRQVFFPGPHDSSESRSAYDRILAEWLTAGRTLNCVSPDGPTVSVVAAAFWRHAQSRYLGPDGLPTGEHENYRAALRALRAMYGDTPAKTFGPKALKALRSHFIADHEVKDAKSGIAVRVTGWCRNYTNRQLKRVQLVFRWAASEELVPASVAASLGMVEALRRGASKARESDPVGPVADETVETTLSYLPPPVRALVQLQRLSGARGGELFALRACDIDVSCPVWKFSPADHKTSHHGHRRTIRFGPRAKVILEPLITTDVQQFLFRPADAVIWANQRQADKATETSRTLPRKEAKGRRTRPNYDSNTYARTIARACDMAFPLPSDLRRMKVAGMKSNGRRCWRWETHVEWAERLGKRWDEVQRWRAEHRWSPHRLRHSAATAFRRDGDFESAKILLGHASDSMTQKYAERDDRKADEVVARLG